MEESAKHQSGQEGDLLKEVLCVHCLEPIPFEANLCRHCKAPQNFLASTLPYERIHAEGFLLRRAVEGTRSVLVLVGIWILFFPAVATLFCLAVVFPGGTYYFVSGATDSPVSVSVVFSSLGSLVGVVILYRTTVNFIRKRRAPRWEDGAGSEGQGRAGG